MNTPAAAPEVASERGQRELDMSIGQRLGIGFGLLLLVLMSFAATVFVWHSRSVEAQRTYSEQIAPTTARVDILERSMLYVGIGMRSYLLVPDPQRLATFRRYAAEAQEAIRALERVNADPAGRPIIAEISSRAQPYLEQVNRLVERRNEGGLSPQDEEHVVELRERALASVHRFMDFQRARTDQALLQMAAARDRVSQGLAVLALVGGLMCIIIAYFTTQSIRRSTRQLVEVAGALGRGDWTPALELATATGDATERNEMSRVARAIGAAARALEYRDRQLREKSDRIQAQNQVLQAQNEEIQSQAHVLQAQAEEIQSQAEQLQARNTELIQQGGELRARGEALNEANERKNHFLGVLAHELRNPLAPISNSIYVLKRVAAGSEQALRAHAVIERQTKHMIRLVDDLLDITRISQGKIRVQHEEVDLAAIVRTGLEDQHGALEHGGYVLEVDLPAEGAPLRGDRTRLAQVFGNLLSNAMKFTESGGRISVSVRTDLGTRATVLRVADTGIGMDAALVPLLFKPFSQGADGVKLTNAGLGLGLALVKALVDLHGGTVSARSAGANQGSEFVVSLPLDGVSG